MAWLPRLSPRPCRIEAAQVRITALVAAKPIIDATNAAVELQGIKPEHTLGEQGGFIVEVPDAEHRR